MTPEAATPDELAVDHIQVQKTYRPTMHCELATSCAQAQRMTKEVELELARTFVLEATPTLLPYR